MTTDSAHHYWNDMWAKADGTSKWAQPEPEVIAHARTLPKGSRVLDLGAGIGRHALALAQMGFDVAALDAAPESLAAMRAGADTLGVTLDLHQGLMTALPYPDASFDHVLSWNVIYHGDETVVAQSIAPCRPARRTPRYCARFRAPWPWPVPQERAGPTAWCP